MIDNLKKKSANGVKWLMIERIIMQFSSLFIGILLARLLSPDEFGSIAMITVITGFLGIFGDFGLGSAIIQKKNLSKTVIDTAFWGNAGFGIFLMLITMLGSSFIASFYSTPELESLAQVISINFIFIALKVIPESTLRKKLEFKRIFLVRITAVVSSGVLAIALAYLGFGVWTLVIRMLVLSGITMILMWYASSYWPTLTFSKSKFKELMSYSLPLVGSQMVGFATRNMDNMLIGRFLGAGSLGVYSRAYQLMLLPVKQVTGIISKVLFPTFSIIQEDVKRMGQILLKAIWIISNITFPLMLSFFFCADSFVINILGEKWVGVIPVIKILTIAGAVQSVTTLVGSVFNSRGETKLHFKINLISSLFAILVIYFSIPYGLEMIAWGITGISIIFSVIQWYFASKVIKLGFLPVFKSFYKPVVFSMALFLMLFYSFQFFDPLHWLVLVIIPVIIYSFTILLIWVFDRSNFEVAKALFLDVFTKK
jgi:PST family polysaccharide transporter